MLSLLLEHPGQSRSAMGRALGITAQAASVQAQELLDAGMVVDEDGLRVAPRGIQALQQDAQALDEAARRLHAPVAEIQVISAVAAGAVRAGQVVGLWMRDGDLYADALDVQESRGLADNDAGAGDEVRVRAPEGVTPLHPGTIRVFRVPSASQGGIDGLQGPAPKDVIVGAVGNGATILARRAGRLDMRFAAAEGALNAAQRGLDVWLYVGEHRLAESLQKITAGNLGAVRVDVRVEEL